MARQIRVSQVTVPLSHERSQVYEKAAKLAGVRLKDVLSFSIARQSVDARRKDDLKYSYAVDLLLPQKCKYKKSNGKITEITGKSYAPTSSGQRRLSNPIAVIGSGPAGLFCAYLLAKNGYCPVVFERGKPVRERTADVEAFWQGGALDPESNVQFGEGGAGTFSDGKLNTLVKDREGRNRFVLETFVQFGAPEDILYVAKPHIGTDVLRRVVESLREEIIRLGGSFRFSTKVTDLVISRGELTGLILNEGEEFPVGAAILAPGHSARDTFAMLKQRGVSLNPKSFAVGVRIEHPQRMIDASQYGEEAEMSLLPTAAYKLTYHAQNGRSVYSFCMCPGGYVVNASSEEGGLAVNGMSYRQRDGENANAAIIVSVTPEDFPDPADPLSGLAFQRRLEEAAYLAGEGQIPQQTFGDFLRTLGREPESRCDSSGEGRGGFSADQGETASSPGSILPERMEGADYRGRVSSQTKGATHPADLTTIFPPAVNEALAEGISAFGQRIAGFDREDAILSAVESRTSSPIRLVRDETLQSNILGLYPCGEGAGYAGGITSAAMDGLKVAEAIMGCFLPVDGEKACIADQMHWSDNESDTVCCVPRIN